MSRFDVLDGIRGFAALMVLLHHIEGGYRPELRVFYNGFLAVDLFFMLSGFVIAHSYNKKFKDGLPFWTFAKIRLIRLYPMTLLGALLGTVAQFGLYWDSTVLLSLIKQLTFAPSFNTTNIYPLNGIQWTLFFELLINFVYALGLWKLSNRNLFILVIVSFLTLVYTGHHFSSIGVGWGSINFWGGFSRVFFGFFTGIAIYRLVTSHKFNLNTSFSGWMIVATYILVSLAFSVLVKNTWKVDLILVGLVLPIIVFLSATAVCSSIVERQVMYWAGLLSYPVYAIQGPIRNVLIREWGLNSQSLNTYCITLCVIVITSYLALRFFDEPCRRYLRRSFL